MQVFQDANLADCTFFETGGPAETFLTIETSEELADVLKSAKKPFWFLGSGANVLVSDKGLPGTTIHLATSAIYFQDDLVIADAGGSWDKLVEASIKRDFWGLERTSGVPGSVGAAVVGNIAAYGQAVSESLEWVEVIDTSSEDSKPKQLKADGLGFSYRFSNFQTKDFSKYLITKAAFRLSKSAKPLEYASALKVAEELKLDSDDLNQRREIILETRKRIGALVNEAQRERTAGSFFRNPVVSPQLAEKIMAYEERNVSPAEIKQQNKLHSGDMMRVSAAHVMLAAGFRRGQTWGHVRLHPEHILKIENTGGATSQEIYDVAQEIIDTVKQKLGIDLVPEVRFLGEF